MIPYVALRHVISCAQYGTVSYRLSVMIRKIDVEIFHCTVSCTMSFEGRRHSWRILRGDMFDAALSDVSGIPSAKFFQFQHLMWIFCEGYWLQMATWSTKTSPWCPTWRERNANFVLHFWRKSTSTGRISLRQRFAQPRNQSKSFRKNQTFKPLPSWWSQSDMTDLQTERQLNARNLQDTTYPFGNEKRAQRWDGKDWS